MKHTSQCSNIYTSFSESDEENFYPGRRELRSLSKHKKVQSDDSEDNSPLLELKKKMLKSQHSTNKSPLLTLLQLNINQEEKS